MINQDRVREMNKMAILESGVGEKNSRSAPIDGQTLSFYSW